MTLNLSELIPYDNNPRINDEAVADVVESIRQCEYIDPIEIDEDNIILSGHTRYKALKQLKRKTADCIRVSGLTDEQKRKYRLLTNKTGERALWDFELLDKELEAIDFGDFDFGFDDRFTINDIQDMQGFDDNDDEREHFIASFTFPGNKKKIVSAYLRKHKAEIIEKIIRDAEDE